MQTSWTWTTDTRTYPPKCSSEWNLDNVGPFEQTLWHTCCMFHTGLCPRFSTFKHWKNIWKLKPGARRRHKAIMSPLLFLMNFFARWWSHEKKTKRECLTFKMEMIPQWNNKENAWNSTGFKAFSFSELRCERPLGRMKHWNHWTIKATHTHMEGFWTLITHLGRSSDYLWSSAVRNPLPPAPSSLPSPHPLSALLSLK